MKLLQVCNVGDICGGTAACAWSITRSLPEVRHAVLFLSPPTPDTRTAFADCHIAAVEHVSQAIIAPFDPDVVLLHNTPRSRADPLAVPLLVQYLHSRITPAPADVTVACSAWLRSQYPPEAVDGVLYQPTVAVGEATKAPFRDSPSLGAAPRRLVIGRLCTPTPRKWPRELLSFYAWLADRHPLVNWEFVGCPAAMQSQLSAVCSGRARFLPAEPAARRHLQRWDALLYHHPHLTETFGRTVAEALQCGCIPIVDDRGGFREQFGPDAGWLCRSSGEFSRAIEQLHDGSIQQAMSSAALTAGRRFSGGAFAARFRALVAAAASVSG